MRATYYKYLMSIILGLFFSFLIKSNKIYSQVTSPPFGQGTGSSALYGLFFQSNNSPSSLYARNVLLYTQAELSNKGITVGSTISEIHWDLGSTNKISSSGDAILEIYMQNSSSTDIVQDTWANIMLNQSLVGLYTFNTTNNFPGVEGFITFTLDTPFIYSGGSIEIAIDWDASGLIPADPLFDGNGSLYWHYSSTTHDSSMKSSSTSSPPTNFVSGPQSKRVNTKFVYTPLPCSSIPNNLGVSNITASSADFFWDEVSGGATSYNWIVVAAGTGPLGSVIDSGVALGLSASCIGLTNCTSYDLHVQADCGSGNLTAFSTAYDFTANQYGSDAVVNTNDDLNDGECNSLHCSLREALLYKSSVSFCISDTIKLSADLPPKENFVVSGNGNIIDGNGFNGLYCDGSNIMVQNLVFVNCNTAIRAFGDNITIDNCTIKNNIRGIRSSTNNTDPNFGNSLITNCDIFDNTIDGIDAGFYYPTNRLKIYKNRIYNNGDDGIDLSPSQYILIEENIIHSNRRKGINGDNNWRSIFTQNSIYCNEYKGIKCLGGGCLLAPYDIYYSDKLIYGKSEPNTKIEILLVSDNCFEQYSNQGIEYIGNTVADSNGDWIYPVVNEYQAPFKIVTTASMPDFTRSTSEFSEVFFILPDDCILADSLSLNLDPCSTTGIVLDLAEMTYSTPVPTSIHANTFAGNDAWYKLEVPASGNFLVRSNINNQVLPVLEAYKGDCNNLIIQGTTVFNDTIQEMVFENYNPGETLYIRVWDNNNLKVNGCDQFGFNCQSLLHLTAHELSVNKTEWEICDEENAYLLGNPTIISEKDANSFILEFSDNITFTDIENEEDELEAQGLIKEDECLCGQNPLQLWKAGNPVNMETRRKSAIGRGNVDTVNYNYIFEAQEFQVNSYAIGNQYDTDVSMDSQGNFVICWIDQQRGHNYIRLYNSSGNPVTQEFRVGTYFEAQFGGRVSMINNGDFVTVYHEEEDGIFSLYGKRYYANGTSKGLQFNISETSANTSSDTEVKNIAKYGVNGAVDTDSLGNFVVAWHVGRRIFMQRYLSYGNLNGTIIEVGSTVENNINPMPSISVNNNGDYIIVWNGKDIEDNGIYAQRYDANGAPQGSATLVNTIETHNQINPDVTLFDDGSYVVTWQSFEQEGAGLDFGIYMRRFDSGGIALGPETLVNTYITDAQKSPSISGFDDGRFFIAWDSYGQDGVEEGVYGQLFASDGSPLGDEFKLNTFTDPEQEEPATATNGTNLLIGSWVDGANDGSYKGIFAQRYEIAGPKAIPIGTATPSFLLGEEVPYTPIVYSPTDSVSRVRVAIIDTGIDPGHPYLASTIWNNQQVTGTGCHNGDIMGFDYYNNTNNPLDVDGHGTQVNGIVAQDFNPEIQLEMMNVKFHEADKGKVFDALCGLYYAVDNGAEIINLSWGFEASEYPSILNKALSYAADSNDVLIITTAGNTSKNNDIVHKYPANLDIDNMIVVTAYEISSSTGNIRLANYASYGENNVDIAAPGFVETTFLGDTLALSAGTSLAAPWVTRTAATIRGLYPVLTAADVKDCIMSTAKAEAGLLDRVLSDGILDHNAALACARDKAMDCMGIDLFITVNQSIDTTYRSDAWVNSDATVTNNSDVKMYGAEYVGLKPDFEVELGAEYLADIDDCAPNNEPMDFVSSGNNQPLFTIAAHSPNTGKIKSKFYSDGINPVSITVKDASGSDLLDWESNILEKGWYEKIIDVAEVKSGDYEIVFEGKDYEASKRVLLKKESQDK